MRTVQRELFDNLDEDKNGYLDRDECRKLIQLLKRKLPVDELFDGMLAEQTKSAETVPDGSVSFDNFMRVYNDKLGTERRQVRQEVKLMFEKLDTDHTEKITKEQVHSLVKRIRKRLMLLHPPFDIDNDWNLMIYAEGGDPKDTVSPSGSAGVSFNGFETCVPFLLDSSRASVELLVAEHAAFAGGGRQGWGCTRPTRP